MSNKIILLFIILFPFTRLFSQGALDFKMTDLDGVEWHLQNELDKGKTVILDFFFADCLPCQTLTPMVVKMYSDYGADTGQVVVLGISDRDDNTRLRTFETNFNGNYPSCGIEGGGDSITSLYRSWFPFFGWPTYAVICPSGYMEWDLDKNTGLPEIRSAVDHCLLYSEVNEIARPEAPLFYPNPASDNLYVDYKGSEVIEYQIVTLSGKVLMSGFIPAETRGFNISLVNLKGGMYFIHLKSPNFSKSYNLTITQ